MDEQIWFYIIAGIIYFLVNRKKKKPQDDVPATTASNRPQQQRPPVSFEDLLREITEQRTQEVPSKTVDYEEEDEDLPIRKLRAEQEAINREGSNRQFADDESRRVYEESVKQAEGFDIDYTPDSHYANEKLFKGEKKKAEPTIADEIREGLQNTESAKKAIIYGEILNRRY